MRPGTRSAAQSYRPPPDDERSSDYASSPPEGVGLEFDGRDTVRLQRLETTQNQYKPSTTYSPTSPARSHIDIPRRIPHQQATTPLRHSPIVDSDSAVE